MNVGSRLGSTRITSDNQYDYDGTGTYGPPTSTATAEDKSQFQVSANGACSAGGYGFVNLNNSFTGSFSQTMMGHSLTQNLTQFDFLNNEYIWATSDTSLAYTSGASVELIPDRAGYAGTGVTFTPNPYGSLATSAQAIQKSWGYKIFDLDPNSDACNTNQSISPLVLDPSCTGITTDSGDTKDIRVGTDFAWGYKSDAIPVPTGEPYLFLVSSTIPLDIEQDVSGNSYMKTGSITIKGYGQMTDFPGPNSGANEGPGTGDSDLTVVLTATTDASGNPAFQVTVTDPNFNGGASFSTTIPQGQWASLPHFCTASDQSGYDCVFQGDAAYYSDANNIP